MRLFNFKEKKAQKLYEASLEIEDKGEQIKLLEQVIKLNPNHQSALYNLGLVYKYCSCNGLINKGREFTKS